jgi:carbon-monoxide dehydrogenase large subunit
VAAVQGLGGAFLEHLVYDANGQLLYGNLATTCSRRRSTFRRSGRLRSRTTGHRATPLGVKGAGGGVIIPIGGLMANAVGYVLAAFAAMPNQLPLSPARVWHMGSAKRPTGSSE